MRVAVIENGLVTDMIMADDDYRHPLGKLLVPTEEGAIGDTYDGKKFVAPLPSKDDLIAHALRRSTTASHLQIIVPPVAGKLPVRVFIARGHSTRVGMNEATVARLAQRAEKNPDFTVPVPQPRHHKSVMLNGAQFIALNEAITDWYTALHRAHDSVKSAIKNGLIISHDGVHNPPANCFAWPKHYSDLSAEDRAKEDISAV